MHWAYPLVLVLAWSLSWISFWNENESICISVDLVFDIIRFFCNQLRYYQINHYLRNIVVFCILDTFFYTSFWPHVLFGKMLRASGIFCRPTGFRSMLRMKDCNSSSRKAWCMLLSSLCFDICFLVLNPGIFL